MRLVIGGVLALVGVAGYAGVVSLAWVGLPQGLASFVVYLIGGILFITGYVQWCPITRALGISTYRESKSTAEGDASADRPI